MIGRIFRVVRTPVTLLILLGVLLYGAWWGYNNIIKPIPALPPSRASSRRVPKGQLKTTQVMVKVYNGGDRKGLAADVGRSLRGKGFRVTLTTNTVEKIQQTVIVGADANNPEVMFVKTFFKEAVVRPDKRARSFGGRARRQQVRRLQQGRQGHLPGGHHHHLPALPDHRARPRPSAADRACGREACDSSCEPCRAGTSVRRLQA